MSKKSKTRDCPAVGRTIKSIECGENRHRGYNCPANCPHSPFSLPNYAQFGEIEEKVDAKTMSRSLEDPTTSELAKKTLSERMDKNPEAWHAHLLYLFFKHKDKNGQTFAERWKKDNYRGLRGEEALLLEHKSQIRVALLEVQQVFDSETVSCIDLLADPKQAFIFKDTSFAKRVCRFDRLVCPIYPTVHYYRPYGNASDLPKSNSLAPLEVLAAIAQHHGGKPHPDWLLANFYTVLSSCQATIKEKQRLIVENSDINVSSLDYTINQPLKAIGPKLEIAGFKIDAPSDNERKENWQRVYLFAPPEALPKQSKSVDFPMPGEVYHGYVTLKEGKARLHANSQADKKLVQDAFETALGPIAQFQGELVKDLALPQSNNASSQESECIVPELIEDTQGYARTSSHFEIPEGQSIEDFVKENAINAYYQKLLDQPIPQLEKQTPRAAAIDLQLRPKLVEWAKGLANSTDRQNLQDGTDIEINWLFKELGLAEIDFPPPPTRSRLQYDPAPDDDFLDEEDEEDLELEELELLIESRMGDYETAADALAAMEASGCNLIEELYAATDGIIETKQFDVIVPMLICAWLAIVPPGKAAPISQEQAAACTVEFLEATAAQATNPNLSDEEALANICRDPLLLVCLLARLETTNKSLPKRLRLNSEGKAAAFATLLIGVNVLTDAYELANPF